MENHYVSEKAKQKRLKLNEQWNDHDIYECTPRAAALILFYKMIETSQNKSFVHVGKTLFFWDSLERDLLHCFSQEEEQVYRTLDILPKGNLHFNGNFYSSPQEFMDFLTEDNHVMHKRLEIVSGKGLDQVVHGEVDPNFVFEYPPDYPPILLEYALANFDFATAQQILDNPSIDAPDVKVISPRKTHLIQNAIEKAISGRHYDFLNYLLEKYNVLDPTNANFLEPIKLSARYGQRSLFLQLLEKYPSNQHSRLFTVSLETAVEFSSEEFLSWLLDQIKEDFNFDINESKKVNFLSCMYRRGGHKNFEGYVNKLQVDIPWNLLIEDLVKFPGDPETYLKQFHKLGGNLEHLSSPLKVDLLLKVILEKKSTRAVQKFLEAYPSFSESLDDAMLKSMQDKVSTGFLIDLGTTPKMEHFEKLLHFSTLGKDQLERFLQLLSGINNIEEALQTLRIASAFGADALAAVLEKFPELKKNREFLLSQLQHTWKGAAFAGNQLTSDLLTVKIGDSTTKATQKLEPKSKALIETFSTTTNLGPGISMEILIDILAAGGELDKIKELLLNKPEYIYEFWWRLLFAFQFNIDVDRWTPLAKATFPLIDEKKREKLLYNSFKYFNRPLAQLWMSIYPNLTSDNILECFKTGFPSGDPALVDVLYHLGHLNVKDSSGNTLLHFAVDENMCPLIARLMEMGINPDVVNSEGDKPFDVALRNGRITACRIIEGLRSLDRIADLSTSLETAEIKNALISAFLNSQSLDALHLLSRIRLLKNDAQTENILQEVEHFIRFPGTLIVRYPRPFEQLEVLRGYNTGQSTYEELQYSWGQRCEELYQEFYHEFKNTRHTMLETFKQFAKSRAHLKGYEVWRMGYFNPTMGLVTYFHVRYFIYWHLGIKIYKELLTNSGANVDGIKLIDNGYQLLYTPERGEPIGLTRVELKRPFEKGSFRARFLHTFPTEIKQILPHLSQLFEEIKNAPQERSAKELSHELTKKIAYFFWLGVHTTITERGNSQYMLMLHRLLYNLHGFQTGPWNPRYVQPDCIALLLPFERFYQEFYKDLFDYTPFPVQSRE